MSPAPERAQRIPNANNPRVLIRLIGLVAAGVRRQRALAEMLDLDLRTVHYYTQAGEWLGLLATHGDVHLTSHGMQLAFADPNQRLRLYAAAVWRNPFARDLLRGRRELPNLETITTFIMESADRGLSESTARRRASAVRSLLEPAIGRRPGKRTPQGEQIELAFPPRTAPEALWADLGAVQLRAGTDHNPDVYSRVLTMLLNHGEISTGQIRAILDHVGAGDCGLSTYAEMAVTRGDAVRIADRLVVTRGAIERREVAPHGTLIAFTDPAYRAWIDAVLEPAPTGLKATREFERLAARHAAWDARIFGAPLTHATAPAAVASVLPGRDPRSLPIAGSAGAPLPETHEPFLSVLDVEGLPVCFPACLSQVAGGVSATNAVLRRVREAPVGVRLPGPADLRVRVHGGLLHPGETLPRSVPDNLSLRLRLLTQTPVLSLFAALLLLARRPDMRVRITDPGGGPVVTWGRAKVGPLLAVLAEFCRAQGWVCAHPVSGGLADHTLEAVARALGIGTRAGRRLVMDERLFVLLQEEPEARLTYEAMLPLVDRLQSWLDALDGEGSLSTTRAVGGGA